MDVGEQETLTEGIVGLIGGGFPPPFEPPPPHAEVNRSGALRNSAYTTRRSLFRESRHDMKAILHSPHEPAKPVISAFGGQSNPRRTQMREMSCDSANRSIPRDQHLSTRSRSLTPS